MSTTAKQSAEISNLSRDLRLICLRVGPVLGNALKFEVAATGLKCLIQSLEQSGIAQEEVRTKSDCRI